MWLLLKGLALRFAIGRTVGGMLSTLFVVLLPIAGILKFVGLPLLIVLGVLGAPVFLLLAAGLFAIGLYGALSQQSIVMIMMGLELMLNGVIVGAAAFWHYLAPADASGQVIVVIAVVAMAVEMRRPPMAMVAATTIHRFGMISW